MSSSPPPPPPTAPCSREVASLQESQPVPLRLLWESRRHLDEIRDVSSHTCSQPACRDTPENVTTLTGGVIISMVTTKGTVTLDFLCCQISCSLLVITKQTNKKGHYRFRNFYYKIETKWQRGEEPCCRKKVIKECDQNEKKDVEDGGESRHIWFREHGHEETELDVAEVKMFTRMEQGTQRDRTCVFRLGWFGHVQRRDR